MTMIGVKATGRIGDDTDFVIFKISDVDYIRMTHPTKNKTALPTYYTPQGAYYQLRTLDDVEMALKPRGFYKYDQSTIVNRKNIKHIHSTKTDTFIEFFSGGVISVSKRPGRL